MKDFCHTCFNSKTGSVLKQNPKCTKCTIDTKAINDTPCNYEPITIFDSLKKMSVEERKSYFNHSHISEDELYQDKCIINDIDIVSYNPRICKAFTDKNCGFENPTSEICFNCTKVWLMSEIER